MRGYKENFKVSMYVAISDIKSWPLFLDGLTDIEQLIGVRLLQSNIKVWCVF